MSVYVGKNVSIKIQVPVEDEPHTVPSDSPYTVTLDYSPISDRDLDGVSNELAHVTVKDVLGNSVTPASVDDETGEVTFNSGDAGKDIKVGYSYDSDPYLAQEITIEPRQAVEGVDALGSDTIQVWAALLKEFAGSIKKTFKPGDKVQLDPFNFAFNCCASANGGSASLSPGEQYGYPAWRAIDGDLSTDARSEATAPYDWYLEVSFAERQRIDKVVLSAGFWSGYNTNLKITYWDGFAWQDYVAFVEADFPYEVHPTKAFYKTVTTDKIRVQGALSNQTYNPALYEVEAYRTELTVYGMIVSFARGSDTVRIGFDKVVFPEGSISSPKNQPVFMVTPFKAVAAKTIS